MILDHCSNHIHNVKKIYVEPDFTSSTYILQEIYNRLELKSNSYAPRPVL